MTGEAWRRELRLGPVGYAARPRSVLKPLRFGTRVWVRRFDRSWHGSDDNGVRAQASRGRVGSDGVRVATVTVGVQHGHAVQSYQAGVSWPVRAGWPSRMRSCLLGSGYPLTWWERLAQDAARRWL